MPNNDLLKDFITRTDKALESLQGDVKDLMKFRWMVMGGAAVSSFIFTVLFELAKAMAGGK